MQSLAAIAHPTRRRIVELLAERERTAGELVAEFDLSAPAISQHLNVLRDAGLVTTRAEGQSRIQALNPDGFDDLEAWLQRTRSVWSSRLDALERELRAEDAANARAAKQNPASPSAPSS
jgi:DNA-binding transcriptional ArsR family regulator